MKPACRAGWLIGVLLSGCMSRIALDEAVMAYDEAATDSLSRQLLLNIARARQHLPMHFTGIANVAATFNFQLNVGATPALTGNLGGLIAPVFGGSMAENPTISIVPIEGEAFTRRFLTPLSADRIILLLRQGYDVDMLLRLVAGELRLEENGTETTYHNQPTVRTGYRQFRRAVLHLSTIQDRNALHVEPPGLQESGDSVFPDILTNYDPARLTAAEREALNEWGKTGSPDEIRIDIRPGHTGGEYPMRGRLRLRSFHSLLNFIGSDKGAGQEYSVDRDPRSPDVSENPVHTLDVVEGADKDCRHELSVTLNSHRYCLAESSPSFWNREAFRVIYQLFQMTVANLPRNDGPDITIAK